MLYSTKNYINLHSLFFVMSGVNLIKPPEFPILLTFTSLLLLFDVDSLFFELLKLGIFKFSSSSVPSTHSLEILECLSVSCTFGTLASVLCFEALSSGMAAGCSPVFNMPLTFFTSSLLHRLPGVFKIGAIRFLVALCPIFLMSLPFLFSLQPFFDDAECFSKKYIDL